LAAHTLLGQKAGATAAEMAEAQAGRSADPRTAAALSFALMVVENRAAVTTSDVQALRAAGFDDGEIVEILAYVALPVHQLRKCRPERGRGLPRHQAQPRRLTNGPDAGGAMRSAHMPASRRGVDMTAIAPELAVSQRFNSPRPLSLAALRGKVIVLHAFQMLCPGCVAHALPQAERLHRLFNHRSDVAVVGLHTVFEHHAAMTPVSLEAFIHEYRLTFPIGVDEASNGDPIP